MTYQVGDKVKVREDLVDFEVYGGLDWLAPGMTSLSGKILTITDLDEYCDGYVYDFEETVFTLSEEMIECKVVFKIKCTRSQDDRFIVGEEYFVDKDGQIVGDNMIVGLTISSYNSWYKACKWVDYEFELLEDYTKTENTEEEVKMSTYKVGDLVEFKEWFNEFKGVGKIVEIDNGIVRPYLIELPTELHGKGHNGNDISCKKYDEKNYWWIGDEHIKCKVDQVCDEVKQATEEPTKTEVKRITKGIDNLVQDVYRGVQDKKGNIKFNKVKMKNLCFVKFDGCEKFIHLTILLTQD